MSLAGYNNKKVKGLKLKTITICLIAVLLALCSIFIVSLVNIRDGYKTLSRTDEERLKYQQSAQMVKEGSYYLTEQVHLYTITGDKQYADKYFEEINVTKRRTNAVEDLRLTTVITSAQQYLIEALELSEKLKEREVYAICLVADANAEDNSLEADAYLATYDPAVAACVLSQTDSELSPAEKRKLAVNVVFDEGYLQFRDSIDSNIQSFLNSTYNLTENTKATALKTIESNLFQQSIFIVLVLLLTVRR